MFLNYFSSQKQRILSIGLSIEQIYCTRHKIGITPLVIGIEEHLGIIVAQGDAAPRKAISETLCKSKFYAAVHLLAVEDYKRICSRVYHNLLYITKAGIAE